VPVISVFLSGRPLWVNPLLNVSDAFVAGWYPGSEGAGVADVLVGDQRGKPRYDFTGKLPMSWPKSAAQTALNLGQQVYDPLFAYGYGLDDHSRVKLARLSEDPGVKVAEGHTDQYFVKGHTLTPWRFALRENGKTTLVPDRAEAFSLDGGAIAIAPIDAGGVQEGGRQLTWTGGKGAEVLLTGGTIDLLRQANADMSLEIEYRVDRPPAGAVQLAMGCDPGCGGALALEPILSKAPVGVWQTLKVSLACLREKGADLRRIAAPLVLESSDRAQLSIAGVTLASDANGAICPE
jgi:beta-glucosidase